MYEASKTTPPPPQNPPLPFLRLNNRGNSSPVCQKCPKATTQDPHYFIYFVPYGKIVSERTMFFICLSGILSFLYGCEVREPDRKITRSSRDKCLATMATPFANCTLDIYSSKESTYCLSVGRSSNENDTTFP